MRHLITGASVALTLAIASASNGFAQPQNNDFDQSDRFTNRDLLEQSERDQRLWLSGVVVGMVGGLGLRDTEAGACLGRWYFDDPAQAFANVKASMEAFPDHEPNVIVIALARRSCERVTPMNGDG